jgi:hypothetical protein
MKHLSMTNECLKVKDRREGKMIAQQ